MYAKLNNLNERLKPIKSLLERVDYNEERIFVAESRFYDCQLQLTLAVRNTNIEASIWLSDYEVHDYTNEFFVFGESDESPNYWFLKDFATCSQKAKALKEIKDILLGKVNPMFEELTKIETLQYA